MLGDIKDKTVQVIIEVIVIGMVVTKEVEIDQERCHSQEVIVVIELEVSATVGLGQDPEPVLIGIEYDAIIVESMIILQRIALTAEKKGS